MAGVLNGRRVAILAADGVERVELERPRQALEEASARTVVVSIASGEIQARDHDLEDAGTFAVDQPVGEASVDDYEALLLPGGTVNPDKLRMEPAAVEFVRDFVRSGKPDGTSSGPASRSPRSATASGTSSRPTSRAAAG